MVEYYAGLSHHINFSQLPSPVGRFDLLEIIGEGTYGEVYHARSKDNGRSVAVKIMESIADNIEEIDEEFLVLRDLCLHPNIPSFYGLYLKLSNDNKREEDQLWIVMELCAGGSVTDLVQGMKKAQDRLPEKIIAFILKETCDALYYLHRNHCMHRDVKGHNILITDEGNIKLVDFGVSSHLATTMGKRNTSVGTPYWMAPEVIACERQMDYAYDGRCDVWSLGITAIELADGEPPLSHLHPMRALFHIPRNPPPHLRKPNDWSTAFNDFISECLIKDFEQRPLVSELLAHPFLKQVPYYTDELKRTLKHIVAKVRQKGFPKRAPDATSKHGKLKTDRKSRHQSVLVEDLATLESLNESIIVDQLQKRFGKGQIYTYIGDILIAVNPFKSLELYGEQHSQMYRNRSKGENPPHIYAVADSAYHSMLHQKQNQCVVISGESGAGKTESANLLLKQLVCLGKAPNRNLETKILQVNPLMEAFGNAKTGINDNSSRFGKYLDITFTKTGKVTGAKLSVYLLEQSRVVSQARGEENFHIFYYMYDGLAEEGRLGDYFLHAHSNCRVHRYLASYNDRASSSLNNVQCYKRVKQGFQLLGFRQNDADSIFSVLAAILHLGDVQFEDSEMIHSHNKCSVKNPALVPIVARLLGVNATVLLEVLTTSTVVTRGESILKNNTIQEAEATRDAMAKAIYGRLFDWIVNQINRLLSPGRIAYGEPLAVGLLDIFGFENFKTNSFEQLCINIANEQIQYYFNQHIFRWEQQEYLSENIPVELVSFNDNRPLLDMLLSRPLGLLALLDEESHFPNATDTSLIDKFHNNIKNPYYIRPKGNALNFTIIHYAGKVTYDARQFLTKNRYYISLEVIHLYRQSSIPIVQSLFGSPLTKTGHLYTVNGSNGSAPSTEQLNGGGGGGATVIQLDKLVNANHQQQLDNFNDNTVYVGLVSQTKAQQTVATYFRFSLMDLLHKLTNGYPHFVRCLKPNDQKQALMFGKEKILEQLQYTGIMETIKIRQQGFSHRIPFAEFIRRYGFLVFSYAERIVANRDSCKLLLARLNMDGWALGKTKVFLKYYHVEYLSRVYEEQIRKIVRVQALVRRWLAKRRAEKERWSVARSVVIVQKYARGWLARKRLSDAKANTMVRNRQGASSTSPDSTPKRSKATENGHHHHHIHHHSQHQLAHNGRHHQQPSTPYHQQQQHRAPADAALLIQKHVRGYLTRKKMKAAGNNRSQESRSSSHSNQGARSNGQAPRFVSERMQLYQQRDSSSIELYNQRNGLTSPINGVNDKHNNRPKLSKPIGSNQHNGHSNNKHQYENGRNEEQRRQSGGKNGNHHHHYSPSRNGHHNGHNGQQQQNSYPTHFQKLELPLNIKYGKSHKDESIILINSINQDLKSQLQQTQEKENLASRKWWELIKHSSIDLDDDTSTSSSSRATSNGDPHHHQPVKKGVRDLNDREEITPRKQVANGHPHHHHHQHQSRHQQQVNAHLNQQHHHHHSPRSASNGGGRAKSNGTADSKVVVEVESWWSRCGSGSGVYPRGPEPAHRSSPTTSDQGPFEFRKILKPTSRATNRSDGSCNDISDSNDTNGPFDFRKLLRKTNNAPTDTLKRYKGLTTTESSHI